MRLYLKLRYKAPSQSCHSFMRIMIPLQGYFPSRYSWYLLQCSSSPIHFCWYEWPSQDISYNTWQCLLSWVRIHSAHIWSIQGPVSLLQHHAIKVLWWPWSILVRLPLHCLRDSTPNILRLSLHAFDLFRFSFSHSSLWLLIISLLFARTCFMGILLYFFIILFLP